MPWPLPAWLPFGDGEALPGYQYVKCGFKKSTFLYYNGVHCTGSEHVPPVGSPALLCFNHSNGLVDSMMIIRSCPRMVRFMAKDTLWKIPGIGLLVSGAGAVPVMRREEHGADADTTASLAAVLEALQQGACVGVAPEGNSKMRTILDLPLKKGVGHLAVEAALNRQVAGMADATVRVVPCGLSFLQRERWRSEAMAAYGEPIVVDEEFLQRFGLSGLSVAEAKQSSQYKAAVGEVMERLTAALQALTPTLPALARPVDAAQVLEGDFRVLATGVAAARVARPGGAEVSLPEWLGVVRHYAVELSSEKHVTLAQSVRDYQRALDTVGLRDAQVLVGSRPGSCALLAGLVGLSLLGAALVLLALPGLLPWSPILLLCLWQEGRIREQGLVPSLPGLTGPAAELPGPVRRRRNFDTLADSKMMIGWVLSYPLRLGGCAAARLRGHSVLVSLFAGCALLPLAMWLSVRLLEEGFAAWRTALSQWALLRVPAAKLEALASRRCELAEAIAKLPGEAEPVGLPPANWSPRSFFLPWRRWKADWYESLLSGGDLSFLGVHERAGPPSPPGSQGPASPLLA